MPSQDKEFQEQSGTDTQTLILTYNELLQLVSQGKQDVIVKFVQVGLLLAKHSLEQKNFTVAKQILSQLRQYSHQASFLSGELWAGLNLAIICLNEGDLSLARDYASLVFKSFLDLQQASSSTLEPPDRMIVYDILIHIADAYYYNLEDFNSAASLASQAVTLVPQKWIGYFLLGNSQLRLEQYKAAANTWEQAIALDPTDANSYASFATALLQLGHPEKAVTALSKAMHLSPNDAKYYMQRGRIYQLLNQHADAIGDFTSILHLYEQSPKNEEESLPAPRSRLEYERSTPLRDQADFARMLRVRSYQALGQIESAIADLNYLIQQGDEVAKLAGYLFKGDLYKELKQYEEAIATYSSAIQLQPGHSQAHLERSDAYIHQGLLDEAIADIASVTQNVSETNLEEILEQLDKILSHQSVHGLAWKWRGYVYLKLARPSLAEKDFTHALTVLPADSEIYLWRGLTRITNSPLPEEEQWNNSLTLERTKDAIDDLGYAIHLAPDNTEALTAFKWLVDRASADDYIFYWLMENGNHENGVFSILPLMQDTLGRYLQATSLAESRHWKEAIKEYRATQSELLDAGFPVWATRLHLNIADNYLRLYELQLALDHIAQVEQLFAVTLQPLTADLLSLAEEVKQKQLLKSGKIPAMPQVEYLEVYGIGYREINLYSRLLKAEVYTRIGDSARAVSALEDIEDFVAAGSAQKFSFQGLISIAIIFRDAGKFTDALGWLRRIEKHAEDPEERMKLFSTFGTIYEFLNDSDNALHSYKQAYEIAVREHGESLMHVETNLAGCYFRRGQIREALDILTHVDSEIDQKAHSEHDLYVYYSLLAEVLWLLGISGDAQQAILKALTIAEGVRGDLKIFNDRISWQARQEVIYRMGVRIALANNDRRTSFELVERSRARAFADQLATGRLPLPPSAQKLQETESYMLKKKELLLLLTNSIKVFGKSFIDYEILDELELVDEDTDVLEKESDGSQSVSVFKIEGQLAEIDDRLMNIHQMMEEARFASGIVISSLALSLSEVRQLLT